MAPRYLTEKWAGALSEALNDDERVRKGVAGQQALVAFNVKGGPDGDVDYYYEFTGERVEIHIGAPARDADASISMPYETAVQVSSGIISGQSAMSGGKAQATGNVMKVMALAGAMQSAADIESDLDVDY
jgi:putative sterol carrier protein